MDLILSLILTFVVGESTPNSCHDFGSPASGIMITNILVYEKLTPNNQLMHSTTKVLSSMGTFSNEEIGLTEHNHSHGLIAIIVLLQKYKHFRFINYSTNLCFTINFTLTS